MTNALKAPVPGTDPLASDVAQLSNLFNALLDAGVLQLVGPQNTPAAPTAAASGTAGNLSGTYLWKVVLITGWKQSDGSYYVSGFVPSADSASVTITNNSANLSSLATGTAVVIGRAIYRVATGGASGSEKFAGIIWDNTTTTWTDNVADANLGTGMPTSTSTPAAYGTAIPAAVPTSNTTGVSLFVPSLSATTVTNTPFFNAGFESNAVNLATSADLNTVTSSGFYRLQATPTNAPAGGNVDYGQMIVSRGNDTIFQIVTGFQNNEYYMRQANGIGGAATWQPWRRLWHDGNQQAVGTTSSPTFAGMNLDGGNGSFVTTQAYELGMDSRTTNLTYTSGQLTEVQVVDPSNANAVVSTVTLTYTNGNLTQVQEVADGHTITTTLNYTSGQLSSVTKAVQ